MTIFDDLYLYTFFKKNISAAARMRFIFVTRLAENKALFISGLIINKIYTLLGKRTLRLTVSLTVWQGSQDMGNVFVRKT